jgi:hypothetical protein
MRLRAIVTCALLIAAFSCAAASAQLPREITSQYRPALEKLREAYTHATFEGTASLALPRSGKSRTQDFVFRASGPRRRLESTTTAQTEMGLTVGAKKLQMATPIGSLSTYTNAHSTSQVFDDARERSYGDTLSQIDNDCLLNYPYALDSSGTILDMLLKPGVKITEVKKIDAQGESFVQISYEETGTHAGHSGKWKGRLVVSPSEGWALRGFTRTLAGSHPVTQRAKLTYSGEQDGIPLVSTIETETLEGKTPVKREAIEITDSKLGDPDEYYFTSFAF